MKIAKASGSNIGRTITVMFRVTLAASVNDALSDQNKTKQVENVRNMWQRQVAISIMIAPARYLPLRKMFLSFLLP